MLEVDHFAFEVSNLDKAIEFYTEVLGLRLLSRNVSQEVQEEYALFELEGGKLELIQSLNTTSLQKPDPRPPYCPHLAFGTADMEKTVSMIKEKQIPIVKGPLEIQGAEKWIYISDPDNNVIEFIQWL